MLLTLFRALSGRGRGPSGELEEMQLRLDEAIAENNKVAAVIEEKVRNVAEAFDRRSDE